MQKKCLIILALSAITFCLVGEGWVHKEASELARAVGENQAKGLIEEFDKRLEPSLLNLEKFGDKLLSLGQDLHVTLKNFEKHVPTLFTAIAATYVTSLTLQYGVPFFAKIIERQLMLPKLIVELSNHSFTEQLASIFNSSQEPLSMVFGQELDQQLHDLIKISSEIHTKIKQGDKTIKYRNLMLYGPPGTGKMIFAKELAKRSGLKYAYMRSSLFLKFNEEDALKALNDLFDWAKKNKELMIFIDQPELFLSQHAHMDSQNKIYKLQNDFFNYTKERSSQFMLVFATNHKDILDSNIYSRIDDMIEMPLPSKNQRIAILNLYKNKILVDAKNKKSTIDSTLHHLDSTTIERVAEKTKGFSYSDLEGIVNTFKINTDIKELAAVNSDLINKIVERALKKHQAFINDKQLGFIED